MGIIQVQELMRKEDVSKIKESNEHGQEGGKNEMDFHDDKSGNDLDIPGSELDDEQENIGAEDEENNNSILNRI